VGSAITLTLTDKCSDADSDNLSFSLLSGLPADDSIVNTVVDMVYTFTPGMGDTGMHYPRIIAKDPKGLSDTLTIAFSIRLPNIDTLPPAIIILSPSKDTVIDRDSCVIRMKCIDASGITSVVCSLGTQTFNATRSPTDSIFAGTVKGLTPEAYSTITITATDASTARNTATATVKIKYDNDRTKPIVSLFDPAKDSLSINANSYAAKVISKDSSGVASVVYTFGTTNFPATKISDSVWTGTISGLVSGVFNKILVVATDASVNSNKDTMTFYIKYDPTMTDLTGPVFFPKNGPANNAFVVDSTVNIVDSISDPSGVDSVYWTQNSKNPKLLELVAGSTYLYSLVDTLHRYHLDTIVIFAQDKSTNRNKSSQTIILNYNVPPEINDTAVSTNRNVAKTWTLNALSVDGDPLTWTRLTLPSALNGTMTGMLPSVTFTPAANWFGADSFLVRVTDGHWSDTAKIKITVSNVLSPPNAIKQFVSMYEDTSIIITLSAMDSAGLSIVNWEISRQPMHGTLTGSGATRTYMSTQSYFGADTFLFRANDGINWSDTGIVAINVVKVNHAPLWKQSVVELSVKEGKTLSFDLNTVFDRDPDGDSVVFSKKSGVGALVGRSWSWMPGFTAAATNPTSCVITATDNGSPSKFADITFSITVADSLCKLTTAVALGNGTIQVSGMTFDPGTVVQVTANPATDYVFKSWAGDVPSANQNAATVSITMTTDKSINATFVKTIETVTLNIGESFVHGTTYAEGYFFASTRTIPAKLLRFSANNLSDYADITFSTGHDGADQVVYVPSKRKLYVVFASDSNITIAEVDPFTMAYTEEKIKDTKHGATSFGHGGNQSITSDGSYLYVLNCMWDTTKIYKYSLTSFSSVPVDIAVMDTGYTYGHSIEYSETDGMLYATNCTSSPWAAKVNPASMKIVQESHYDGATFTDDFGLNQDYLFAGMEAYYNSPYSGVVFRISRNNLTQMVPVNTGSKGNSTNFDGQCYGVRYYGNYIWAVFASSPGTLTRIDPVSLEYKNYRLDYNTPNEIIWDGKRLLITYWGQDPGKIQAFDPSVYLTKDREIP
jgi:hypothetical protein